MEYQFIISGEIGVAYDWWTGQRGTTAKDVRDFLAAHKDEEVHIAVSSPGGYVDAGLEIYQLVKDHGKVHMHILGMTASAATFLTMGAQSVDMVDGSLMLIHNASTAVMERQSANKKQLDELIAKYQKEREDLNTIDKVIASLYAKRSGKSIEDCMAKMDKEAWLSPQDALDFGLIDAIREDGEASKHAKNLRRIYSNNIFKEFGLPPFPQQQESETVADEHGNPTKSFIQKSVEAVKAFFRNEPAVNEKPMIKTFVNVMALLAITAGFKPNEDDTISLSQDQMKKVDDQLGTLEQQVKDANEAKEDLQKKLDAANASLKKAKDDLSAAEEKVKNLKGAPGDETSQKPADTRETDDEDEKFLNEARESYNRIKDL
ncbi:MAG: ATP-dependent Clp protease proteolytic subunit [Prevotella sp.]|nr:ATP-dependent Clp protease proteolytic subunit [Prevotella sp.]